MASGYIKNGITANGSVAAIITNNVVTGSGPVGVPLAAQNGIQVAFGATAVVRGNTVSGNDYTPALRNYNFSGIGFLNLIRYCYKFFLLLFQFSQNAFFQRHCTKQRFVPIRHIDALVTLRSSMSTR